MCLSNRVILVTGGNKGIGAATAQLLHLQGATIIIQYHSDVIAAQELANQFKNQRVHMVQADLSKANGAEKLWIAPMKCEGSIDGTVNCAGSMRSANTDWSYEKWKASWDYTLQLNVISLAWLTQKAASFFADKNAGIIVNVSSRAAYIGSPDANFCNYAASKGAVMSLTKTIARAYANKNVLAYVVAPGLVETEMTQDFIDAHGLSAITQNIPLGEVAKPIDIAEVICFLMSGKARHAVGSTIHINGGSLYLMSQ